MTDGPGAQINEVFEGLGWKDSFTIKLNSRLILDGLFEVCGVPENLIRPISSAVDKLDVSICRRFGAPSLIFAHPRNEPIPGQSDMVHLIGI